MKRTWSIVIGLLLVLVALPAMAQYTGTIQGAVKDPSGAAIPNTIIVVRNTATNATRTVSTNDQGEYTVPDLAAGVYEVRASQKTFKDAITQNVELHVSSTSVVNMQMQMGTATESVTVEATAIGVETTSGAVGGVVDGQQVRELPLNGRSFVQLTQLQPGVSAANNFDSKNKGLLSGVDFAVNGNPTTNNLFLVDGANNNDVGSNRTILVYPSIEAISEFKMVTNAYGVEYGQASGSVISIITKGGGNQLHGSGFYFGRNDLLNATDYFAARNESLVKQQGGNLPNDGKDKLRRNDFGYSIGGPIKKDKLFFFFSQEWNREIRGNTRSACVPSAAERIGDFSGTLSCGATVPHVPGNKAILIPKIINPDPAGLLLAQLLPLPNVTPSAATQGNNWFQSLGSKVNWREENARVDYNLTKNHVASFRYTQDSWVNPAPNAQGFWGDDPFPAVEGNWSQPSKSAIGKVTSTFGSTMVNDAQFSYSNNRIVTTLGGTNPGLVSQIDAAIPTIYPASQKLPTGMPTIWGGLGQYGSGQNLWSIFPYSNSMDLYTVKDDFSKVMGNHSLKVGAYVSSNSKNEDNFGGQDRPQFGGAKDTSDTGNALANAMIRGTVYGIGESTINPVDQGRWHDIEFYVGDTWKVRRNLTVDYGFRWSFLRESYDANDQISSWNPAFYNPNGNINDPCNGLVLVPGTNFCKTILGAGVSAGTPGVNRALVNNNNHDIAPRLGIAWDPKGDGKTAVRIGAGQFFQRERVSPQVGLANNAPFALATNVDRTLDVAPAPGAATTSPTASRDPRGVTPNSWQWNVSVERELARETTVQLGYVGNRGLHLTSSLDANSVLSQNRILAAFKSGSDQNPYRLAQGFNSITQFLRTGWSDYHSLQASFKTRITSHARVQASYTWSHSIANLELDNSSGGASQGEFSDPNNPNLDKGNSTINRPQIFVANAIFYLPSFTGSNNVTKAALGGWEFATISTIESGNSISLYSNGGATDLNLPGSNALNTLSGTGYQNNQRVSVNPGVACDSSTPGSLSNQIFNPNTFSVVGFKIGSIGNMPRGYCHGPNLVNSDLALYKNWTAFSERLHIQFRVEAFNAFNTTNFRGDKININPLAGGKVSCGTTACSPTNNIVTKFTLDSPTSSSFGQATGDRGPREIQYALKFTF